MPMGLQTDSRFPPLQRDAGTLKALRCVMKKSAPLVLLIASLCFINACGGGSTPPPPPPPAPTLTLSASSSTVTLGESVMLTWSSTNATSCTASASPNESDWSGLEPISGSLSVTPASTGTSTYTLQCTGAGGEASHATSVMANIGALAIASGAPPNGTVGQRYSP